MPEPVALLNGAPVKAPDTSAARLLGLTCFETILVLGGQPRHLQRHTDRLSASAETLGLTPQGGMPAIAEHLEQAIAAFQAPTGIARVSLHARATPTGLSLDDPSCDVLVLVTEPRYGDLSTGVTAITSTLRAPDPASRPAHVKAPSLARFLAHREARERGAFEGLMLDARGHVVSGTRSNLWAVLDGTLTTPPSPPALPGVTRSLVLDHVDEAREAQIHRDQLAEAEELIVSFTGPGVVPVVELDGAPVGDGQPGAWWRALAKVIPRAP